MIALPSYPKILGALAVVALVLGAYKYVSSLQDDNKQLTKVNTELNVSNESLKLDKERTVSSLNTSKANLSIVNQKFKKAQAQKEEVIRIFGDHDFEKLLRAKPEWMAKKMNAATKDVFREIEHESN